MHQAQAAYFQSFLGLCLILTLPSLGLLGHLSQSKQLDGNARGFEGMGLFISILSFILLPVMYVHHVEHTYYFIL